VEGLFAEGKGDRRARGATRKESEKEKGKRQRRTIEEEERQHDLFLDLRNLGRRKSSKSTNSLSMILNLWEIGKKKKKEMYLMTMY
jgi:hypothetical protein